ncbi:DUF4113 domain-containing protein [Salmonirosea aquatica]|uniref:DUF4113 domain-containing protein n=1 Tax=Salmonirosea aquatica TaxID=2654236 RepID=UPI003571158A
MKYALHGLSQIYRAGYEYKKAGVIVTGIIPDDQVQQSMFDNGSRDRWDQISKAMDRINGKYGRDTISFAVQGTKGKRTWQPRAERRSAAFTTDWHQLPKVSMSD